MSMKKIISLWIAFVLLLFALPLNVSAKTEPIALVVDKGGYLTDEESNEITEKALEAVLETKMNIVIYVCDNVGSRKTDAAVVDHADVTYEQLCGIDTDGVLFMINLDTKYDYISTSGVAINYFSDYRIDKMFDWFYDDLVRENYAKAALTFIDSLLYYYRQGKANNQTEIGGKWVDPEELMTLFFVTVIITLIIGAIIYTSNKNKYRLQKPNTRDYMVNGSMLLNQSTDTYIGTVVNRVYSPRSSGSSGGGGGSSHSSTHRSSGGGSHGGGGRHR